MSSDGSSSSPARVRVPLFLDRDGVLCADRVQYVRRPEDLVWLPGAREALARAVAAGLAPIVVTNQSCVGRGLVAPGELEAIHARLRSEAAAAGGPIAAIYACPHAPEARCACRKPEPGLFLRARDELSLPLAGAFMVGDQPRDIEAGRRAGLRTILVRTGRGSEENGASWVGIAPPERVVADLGEAVDVAIAERTERATRINP